MPKRFLGHGILATAGAILAIALCTSPAAAWPKPGAARAPSLFAGFLGRMNVNHWDCGLDAQGHVCVDPNGSTTVGGGFWPKGTADQYVFGSGIQVAGVVDASLTSFPWHGDTTAAFFEDPSGTHENGSPLSLIWTSNNPSDLATWPRDAFVPNDTSLYDPILIGKANASQEDVWARYWDGDPSKNAGRPHPLGVLVDERGLAWNFPSGNEDIQYWIFTITNITASKASVYAARPDADSLTSLGTRYQAAVSGGFKVTIPDTGYTITNAYFAFAMDADVEASGAKQNYTTVNLPFNMGIAFKSNWYAPDFTYPAAIFSPPIAATVGEVGVKYLKSPLVNPSNPALGEIGLVLYSATVNAGAFGDAANATQVYRYLSGTLNPSKGDAPCNYAPAVPASQVHVCYISTSADDIRFFESSGPFTLKPGESQTIAVAYIGAGPVENAAIKGRGPALNFPNGGPIGPYGPQQPESLATGSQKLSALDSVFGALTVQDKNADGKIEQNEYTVTPRSLLAKGLVAQAVFDAHFLLPFPPDPPGFFLIPGDNQVTVVWKPSPTDVNGDPYFAIASAPFKADGITPNPLYDPNYRRFDVEGYRVYRGRTSGDLTVIAQFDKAGTTFIDYTGELSSPNCAPELGVQKGCPGYDAVTNKFPFDTIYPFTKADTVPLVGTIVQIPPGGRVKLADSSILVISADTAVTGGGTNFPPLKDTALPYAFVDKGVLNGFTYFYTVAAFDLNSVKSTGAGSTSLEGKLPAQSVVPRKSSGQDAGGSSVASVLSPRGTALNAKAPIPAIDATTGEFAGPMPPANGFAAGFVIDVSQLVSTATATFVIDSVTPGNGDIGDGYPGVPTLYYITPVGHAQIVIPIQSDGTDVTVTNAAFTPAVPVSASKGARFGGDTTFSLSVSASVTVPGTWRLTSFGRATANADPANSSQNGPRWWTGAANENTPQPNSKVCTPSAGTCVQADLSLNAGAMTGVGIFHLQAYSTLNSIPMRDLEAMLSTVTRAADFKVYWGASAGGSAVVDSVIDVTHNAVVPFSSVIRGTWGILDDSSFTGLAAASTYDKNNALLTWADAFCVAPVPAFVFTDHGGLPMCSVDAPLRNRAHLSAIAFTSSIDTAVPHLAANGTGFIFYLNGHFFMMKTAALPTAGTVWNARFYAGNVTGTTGSYAFAPADARPPVVQGLKEQQTVTGSTFNAAVTTDSMLAKIHTVPDPYYVTNAFESSPNEKIIRFVNLPSQCILRIYSLSGVLVQMIAVNDATGGAEAQWDLRNRNNQFVASGVYFWHVETPDGKTKVGRFTLVNFAK